MRLNTKGQWCLIIWTSLLIQVSVVVLLILIVIINIPIVCINYLVWTCHQFKILLWGTFSLSPSKSTWLNMFVIWTVNVGLAEDFPSLAGDLKDQPTIVLQSIGLAVSQVFCV